MITRINEAKNKFHATEKANLVVQHVIQIKNGILKHVNGTVKNYRLCIKDYSWSSSSCIGKNGSISEVLLILQ